MRARVNRRDHIKIPKSYVSKHSLAALSGTQNSGEDSLPRQQEVRSFSQGPDNIHLVVSMLVMLMSRIIEQIILLSATCHSSWYNINNNNIFHQFLIFYEKNQNNQRDFSQGKRTQKQTWWCWRHWKRSSRRHDTNRHFHVPNLSTVIPHLTPQIFALDTNLGNSGDPAGNQVLKLWISRLQRNPALKSGRVLWTDGGAPRVEGRIWSHM